MRRLKPHQQDLLARIVKAKGMPLDQVDGRVFRALRTAGLAVLSGTQVVATPAGRLHVKPKLPQGPKARLSAAQEDLLRQIVRHGQLAAEELDGRVAKALLARGMVTISEDHVLLATLEGRAHFDATSATPGRGRKRGAGSPRAEAVRRALRHLEEALPKGAEVLVGDIMASADDVVEAFRQHARRIDRGR
jgi:hypothetical protein